MPYFLDVMITGLCALTIEKDRQEYMRVAMVDQRADRHAPHYPFLLVQRDKIATPLPGGFTLHRPPVDPYTELTAHILDNEDVDFGVIASTHDAVVAPGDPRTDCPAKEDEGFEWILKSKEVDPGVKRDPARILNASDGDVAASARIDGGLFYTTQFAAQRPTSTSIEVLKWQFKTPGGSKSSKYSSDRAIAEVVKASIPFDQKNTTINMTDRSGNRRALTVDLGPLDKPNEATKVWLVNMMLSDLLFDPGVFVRGADAHFSENYRLAVQVRSFIPTPVGKCVTATRGMGNPWCPAMFLG